MHVYSDKYALVESVSNIALSSVVGVLGFMGLTPEQFTTMRSWRAENNRAVSTAPIQ